MSCCLPSCFWPRNWRLWQFCQRNGAGKKLNDCTDEEPLKRSDMATDSGNDATEIFPYLYLGGLGNRNTKFLTERKITAIINGGIFAHLSYISVLIQSTYSDFDSTLSFYAYVKSVCNALELHSAILVLCF